MPTSMRKNQTIEPVTINEITSKYDLLYLDESLVLLDSLKILPEILESRRMSLCVFIGICTSGIITLDVNSRRRVVSNNNVMVVTDESVVNNVNFSDDFDGFGIFMSYKMLHEILSDVAYMSDLFLLSHNHPVFEVSENEIQVARQYLETIRVRINAPSHRYRKEVVRLQILSLFYDFDNAFDKAVNKPQKREKQTRGERLFVNFLQLVETHFRQQRQVQWYAGQMDITPKYLSEVISSVSRRTPNQWIDKFVTTEIRNQLRHTTKKIQDIADEMNFPSQSFFGKYFKENVGVTPSEYRNGIEK